MTISDYDLAHIPDLLKDNGSATWFSAKLIRLIADADKPNRERLRVAFPVEVAAFEDWYYSRGFYAKAVPS